MCQDYSEKVIEILLEKIDKLESENEALRDQLHTTLFTTPISSTINSCGNWYAFPMVCSACGCTPCKCYKTSIG